MLQIKKINDFTKAQEQINNLYENIDKNWKYISNQEGQEIEEWNDRIYTSKNILLTLMQYNHTERSFALFVDDNKDEIPIGIMETSSLRGEFYIELLVTHPGSYGIGKTLIEKAVNESVCLGFQGITNIIASNENAKKIYTKLGFNETKKINSTECLMQLNPLENKEKWEKLENENKWQLTC